MYSQVHAIVTMIISTWLGFSHWEIGKAQLCFLACQWSKWDPCFHTSVCPSPDFIPTIFHPLSLIPAHKWGAWEYSLEDVWMSLSQKKRIKIILPKCVSYSYSNYNFIFDHLINMCVVLVHLYTWLESQLLHFRSRFLMCLGGSRWWPQCLGPCEPHEKSGLSFGLLASSWPAVDSRFVGSKTANGGQHCGTVS